LKADRGVYLFILGVVFLAFLACGRKGPPFLPKKTIAMTVRELRGEWENGLVILKGNVVTERDREKNESDVSGCRIYHARYELENQPCEGCPIEYEVLEEKKGKIITNEKFYCEVSGVKGDGIHFFKVRLLGRNATMGPFSNEARLVVE
jgi:hypothetical protein